MRYYFLSSLLMILACSKFIDYVSRCPTPMERRVMGSPRNCSNGIYHCIRNESYQFVEICNKPQHIPKGNYPYYLGKSDEIFYKKCPDDLYQPLPAWSHEMSDCELKKSSCNSIGQVPCDNGNATNDATCGCDYAKGFVLKESYCLYHICENDLQEIDSDYNCVNKCLPGYERSILKSCEPTNFSANSLGKIPPTLSTAALPKKTNRKEQFSIEKDLTYEHLLFSVISASIIFVTMGLFYETYRSTWRPFTLKISIVIIYISTMGSFFGISIAFADEKRILAYGLTFIVILHFYFTCYLVYLLCVRVMISDPEVYNEEYDKRIVRLLQAAKDGDLQVMKRLLYEGYIDMDDVDINSRSALHLAACEGQYDVLNFIVRNNLCFLEAKDRWNRSAEDNMKCYLNNKNDEKYEKARKLLQKYKKNQTNSREKKYFKENKAIELIKAAEKGDLRKIQRLHVKETDMNLSNSMGQTALHAAVENGMEDIVTYLINNCKVSPFVRWSGRRPIDIAKKGGQEHKIVKDLQYYMSSLLNNDIEEKIPIPSDDYVITVHLLNSAARGDIQQMKRFKTSGYDMSLSNYDLQTALHIAVLENQEYIVELLLKHFKDKQINKDIHKKDRWNMTPWEIAKKSSVQGVYYTFLQHCPELAIEDNVDIKTCKLLNAAAEGNLNALKSLFFEEKIDMNQRDHGGRTALHLAACNDRFKAVEFLIDEAKVDMSLHDRWNRLPTDDKINDEMKTKLKQCQSNRNETTEVKMSATEDTLVHVMQASSKGILHKQTDLRYPYFKMDTFDYLGNTPLHVAADNGNSEDVQYLLKIHDEGRASPFVRNNSRKTPLALVEDKLTFMGENGRDTHEGKKFTEIKYLLQKAMNDAKTIDIEKDNAFEKHEKKAKLFLFHNRICKGDILAVRRFLKTDSNILNQLDYDSRSALHMAAAAGHTHLVEFLLNQVAEKNTKDRYNLTPLDEAKMNGDDEMKQLLKD